MIADLWVYELGDVILLTAAVATKDTVLAKLDQFIFTEDVQLGDVTDTFASLALVGPDRRATCCRSRARWTGSRRSDGARRRRQPACDVRR